MNTKKRIIYYVIFPLIYLIFLDIVLSLFLSNTNNQKLSNLSKSNIYSRLNNDVYHKKVDKKELPEKDISKYWYKDRGYMIHPYLGYVLKQNISSQKEINKYGLYGKEEVYKKNKNTLIVGLLGGSVAKEIFFNMQDILKSELSKIPKYKDKEIIFTSLSMDGYRQPQQLIALNYFLSLGAQYDLLINIDGVNETYINYGYNYGQDLPYFPQNWYIISNLQGEIQNLPLASKVYLLNKKKNDISVFFNRNILNKSQISMIVWNLFNSSYENRIKKLSDKLLENNYLDPEIKKYNDLAFLSQSIDVWYNSTIQIANISKMNGIDYFHFLQPSQYLSNSKPMSIEEKNLAVTSKKYEEIVSEYYPKMINMGNDLNSKNIVSFFDLSSIFKDNSEILYRDDCCHLNEKGYQIMIREMFTKISNSI